jgi:hypothetical protein
MLQNSFQFLADDRRKWTASLQPISTQADLVGISLWTSDPDFISQGPNRHTDDHITYVAPDGSKWSSKCHSHTAPYIGTVSFTFEHTPLSGVGVHHEDNTLNVVSWDNKSLWIRCPDVGPIPSGKTASIQFDVTEGHEPVRV